MTGAEQQWAIERSRARECCPAPQRALSGPGPDDHRSAAGGRNARHHSVATRERSRSVMRSLVIDDEADARARLIRLLGAHPEVAVIGEAQDGLEAIETIEEIRPALLF